MKSRYIHWITFLVIFSLLIPFQSRIENLRLEKSLISSVLADSSINSSLTLKGWFHTIWGDPKDVHGEDKILYLLQDEWGKSTYLDMSLIENTFVELLQMNGKQVEVVIISNESELFKPGVAFKVQEIRVRGEQPQASA